ncbi:gp436 family protein [Candidatus Sumerlaeota bacterium]
MYSSQGDIENRIGDERLIQLADLDGDGSADSDVLTAALERADGLIDAYLGRRYVVPVSPVPDIVRELAVDLAVYALHQTRRETLSERDRRAYEDALAFLRDAAAGRVELEATRNTPEDVRVAPLTTTPLATHEPVFRPGESGSSKLDEF